MPASALRELIALAGLAPGVARSVTIAGSDPVLRTPYRVGTAGAAALAATGIAAAELWQLRGGRAQEVTVDLRAAALSLRATAYLRIDGKPPAPLWDPVSGFYAVRDGTVSIHCNFANHREAAAAVLGVPAERTAMQEAAAKWEGVALEDAIHAAKGCAGLIRDEATWARHPQAEAIAAQPLLEIRRIGDAPPEPLSPGDRPLAGVRVLDLTRVLAGPTAARTLAEHGADVLKITAPHLPHSGDVELDTGVGKLAAHLDLRRAEDVARLNELVREGDVFSQSYRPGALAGRGFSPAELAAIRPGIVAVSLSAWGATGPWRGRRGFDTIVQAVSGMAWRSGDGKKPQFLPVSAIDYVSGYLMAFGAMVALARRAQEGGSWEVRVALARTGRWITDRGLVDGSAAPEIPAAEIAPLLTESRCPDGRLITHFAPVVRLSETPPHWTRPPAPLGWHKTEWPARR
jgi:crotonobetainyl-CoA:carnitine CoA-transferase CaiB-like acyl-CoA transferase